MTVTQDLDIWTLILNASFVVKLVMFLLLAVSFMSWMFIFQKWFSIRRANAQTDKFEREFWGGNDLNSLYQGAVNNRHNIGSLERVFEAGFREARPVATSDESFRKSAGVGAWATDAEEAEILERLRGIGYVE